MKLRHSLFAAAAVLVATPALAQGFGNHVDGVPTPVPRLDLGVSGGINNPAGIYGVEGDFRIDDRFSAGLGFGKGAWGLRITPQARLYPFTIHEAGLFLETGVSLNTGGSMDLRVNGQVAQTVDMYVTPTANIAVGWRQQVGRYFWWSARAGWQQRLYNSNHAVRGGGPIDSNMQGMVNLSNPGGLSLGLSGGFTLL